MRDLRLLARLMRAPFVLVVGLALFSACARQAEQTAPIYAPLPAQSRDAAIGPSFRLPRDVTPLAYTLSLDVDPNQTTFRGHVEISLALDQARESIYLHAQDLNATRVRVVRPSAEPLDGVLDVNLGHGVAAVRLKQPVGPGPVRLEIDYTAPFTAGLKGLYRVDSQGAAYAFTQLEAISARLMFPSFDEPRFKTPFDVRVRVKKGDQAIGNGLLKSRTAFDDKHDEVVFNTTPPLPSYLVALAVGPFDLVKAKAIAANESRSHPLPFGAVAARGRGAELDHALKETPALLTELERYFGIGYPYDKLDLIAVPDFAAGAMENAGAITYRDTYLLVKDDASEGQKRAFAHINAHELAHQWFGNLVTMPWWDDVWLNEAFATWMGDRVLDAVHPEYEAQLGALMYTHYAMHVDGRVSARPIRSKVESEHDIENAFDAITYSKGGAVLAMFERYLGRDVFQDGLRRYMKKHAFKNATAQDLVLALSEASGKSLEPSFFSFLDQPGVPLVSTELSCEGGHASLKLTQARYFPIAIGGEGTPSWRIPACVRFEEAGASREVCTLFADREATLDLNTTQCPSWLLPNANAAGYYHFALREKELAALVDVAADKLNAREQLSLIENIGAALRASVLSADTALQAFEKLGAIRKRQVLEATLSELWVVRDELLDEASMAGYRALVKRLVEADYRTLGMFVREGQTVTGDEKLTRAMVVRAMALSSKDETVRSELMRLGRASLELEADPRLEKLPKELLDTALVVAVQDGGAPVFDRALEMLRKTQDGLVRSRLLSALSSTQDPQLSARALDLALNEPLRTNELLVPLSRQAAMPETREATWAWVTSHLDPLEQKVSDHHADALISVFSDRCSEDAAKALKDTFAPRVNEISGAPRELEMALESIRSCAALKAAQADKARAFFAKRMEVKTKPSKAAKRN